MVFGNVGFKRHWRHAKTASTRDFHTDKAIRGGNIPDVFFSDFYNRYELSDKNADHVPLLLEEAERCN